MFVRRKEFMKLQADIMVFESKLDDLEVIFNIYCKCVHIIIDENKEIIDQNQSLIDTNKIVLDKIEEYLKVKISSE